MCIFSWTQHLLLSESKFHLSSLVCKRVELQKVLLLSEFSFSIAKLNDLGESLNTTIFYYRHHYHDRQENNNSHSILCAIFKRHTWFYTSWVATSRTWWKILLTWWNAKVQRKKLESLIVLTSNMMKVGASFFIWLSLTMP